MSVSAALPVVSTSASSSSATPGADVDEYFKTGPNHILCKVPGLDQSASYPEEFQDSWDMDHVRLPCSNRIYPTDKSLWPEIVKGLSEPIQSAAELDAMMLRWNKTRQAGWNTISLESFLNGRSQQREAEAQARFGKVAGTVSDEYEAQTDPEVFSAVSDQETNPAQGRESGNNNQGQETSTQGPGTHFNFGDHTASQFLSTRERAHFFDVTLPRMQALALRLPELIAKPIPFLKRQQDSAVTLSQEQIACLLANAFFNTLPCRHAPIKKGRRRKPAFKKADSGSGKLQPEGEEHAEDDSGSDFEEDHQHSHQQSHSIHGKGKGASSGKGGRGGANAGNGHRGGAGGAGGGRKVPQAMVRKPRKSRFEGAAAQFEFFDDTVPREAAAASAAELSLVSNKFVDQELEDQLEALSVEEEAEAKRVRQERGPYMPSINFISLFWGDETSKNPCTSTQAAKLRCILHYFDRVTTEMPKGTVTYHRQVLRKPLYMIPGERRWDEAFAFSKVALDATTPLEEAPQGALQLDFANRNIGGGSLDRGAVQEEIRFMICPELIVSRLISERMQPNEAILIKGAERYSNYIGYSKTFEWYSDHQDTTPRDKLGRRMTEICAIDATPFKSRLSRLDQFERYAILREINKALAGYRPSPIQTSEWGLASEPILESHKSTQKTATLPALTRPIATGNWGCGAFGGHLQLKFVIQWLAASMSRSFEPVGTQTRPGDELLYYTFGMAPLAKEIEAFIIAMDAGGAAPEPKRIVESIIQYPRRNPSGEIQGFREKTLLEYLAVAVHFTPKPSKA
ncbi:hypothetical protein BGW38_001407 [Lunasporangiospora selenospora]|uniref:poly(ADP-ribose) glycohydrolase n=1 Tax=Lunasporangiospora selenospora TaxID=979761 RepID=A0A9P6FTU7_9FUNG|nr:hypothetical protein BGW38_001407 [Lunasporangiospora selenospora]